jgi:Tfp pilus assembly protein PilF
MIRTEDRAATLETVFAAVRSHDMPEAKRLAREALAGGLEHPTLLNLRALEHEDAGRLELSLSDLRRAVALAPDDFTILNACGLCLARLDRRDEALDCYDQALAIQPLFGQAWFNRGAVLERLGEPAKAAAAYARAAEIHPQNPHAWANMAFLAPRRGDEAGTRKYAERALALQPDHPTAVMALATVELGEPAAAERRLRSLLAHSLGATEQGLALNLLGDALDAQARFGEAFSAYAEGNAVLRGEAAARYETPNRATIPQTLDWMLDWAERTDETRWRTPPRIVRGSQGELGHVFLVGFPRSGTTLIESTLVAHPLVVSLEEKEALRSGVIEYLADPQAASRLETASDWTLQPLRDDYWAKVKDFGVEPAGKIFVDKNPFHTLKLPLIRKLFPEARIIFAVRDPRDVVLSCFRRRFNLSAATYEFLDLKRTAENYASTMRFGEIMRTKLGLAKHQLVYERLIEDFTGEARALCDFIGIDWRDDMIDFAGRARRGEVSSASGAQISRGLFSDGAGQWRRYREQLLPVMDILAPWVETFGYPPT